VTASASAPTPPVGATGNAVYMIAIAVIVAAVWGNATGGGFTLDATPVVRDNPAIVTFDVGALFSGDWWGGGQAGGLYRPIAGLWLACWMKLGGGAASAVLFGNVLLHVIAAVLRFKLFALLLAGRRRAQFAAAVAAMLPALHPACVEAVASPVGAADLLAVVFGTAAVLGALGTSRASMIGAAVCAGAAVLSKESAVAVPVAAWAASALAPATRPAGRAAWVSAIPALVGVGLALLLRFVVIGGWSAGDPVHAGFSTGARIASAFAAFATSTLPMIVSPSHMIPVVGHLDVAPAAGFNDARAFFGVAAVALALAAAWFAASRGNRAWWWGTLVFFAFLLPVSNILVPTGAISAARFLIPALPWIFLPFVARCICGPADGREGRFEPGLFLCVLIGVNAAYVSACDVAAWKDDPALFAMETTRSERGIHGPYNLAVAKFVTDPDAARGLLNRVTEAPVVVIPGTSVPTEDIEEVRFQAAMNLGKLEVEVSRNPAKARAAFDRAAATARAMRLHAAPWHRTVWREQEAAALRARSAGSVYALTGESNGEVRAAYMADAEADLDAARAITPENPEIAEARARLHLMKGEKELFGKLVTKVLAEHPDTPSAWSLEALRLRSEGKTAAALPLEAKVLLRSPMNTSPEQLLQLGKACLGTADLSVRRQGAELVRIGLMRAQGNPALQRLATEARQALMTASFPQEPVGAPKPP